MRQVRMHAFAGIAFYGLLVSTSAFGEVLIDDDFSSGDLTRHSEHFRWGEAGKLQKAGGSSKVVTAIGPDGLPSKMLEFEYGKWQEARFQLTTEANEIRGTTSKAVYPEIWARYSLRIPDNYYHPLKNGKVAGANDKGWIFLWRGEYQDQIVANRFEWWPVSEPNQALGNSIVALSKGFHKGHDKTPDYIAPGLRVPSNPERAWAIQKSERGKWIDYVFHLKLASGPNKKDGIVEVWKDGVLSLSWDTGSWPKDGDPSHAGFDRGYIMGYHNVSIDEPVRFYIDDFRMGTTAKDVGLDLSKESSPPGAPGQLIQE